MSGSNITPMNLGVPKKIETEVVEGSAEDIEIRNRAHVLWTSSKDGKYFLTSCNEDPSKHICGRCVEKFSCHFSKAKEL